MGLGCKSIMQPSVTAGLADVARCYFHVRKISSIQCPSLNKFMKKTWKFYKHKAHLLFFSSFYLFLFGFCFEGSWDLVYFKAVKQTESPEVNSLSPGRSWWHNWTGTKSIKTEQNRRERKRELIKTFCQKETKAIIKRCKLLFCYTNCVLILQ